MVLWQLAHAAAENPDAVWFGVEALSSGELVGTCCLVDIDWIGRVAELRIRIGAKHAWGTAIIGTLLTLISTGIGIAAPSVGWRAPAIPFALMLLALLLL